MKFQLEHAAALLRRTPVALRAMLEGLDGDWATGNYGENTFSSFDVVGHLIHGERTDWIPRARIILSADGAARTFEPFDRFAQLGWSAGTQIGELIEVFRTLRGENLETLRGFGLTAADLDRTGRHPDFGPVTMRELLATWVVHDLGHIRQIARVMARQYAGAVGPWRVYLPVLTRG